MRRVVIVLSLAIAALFAFGHPLRWTTAALLMSDIAASGERSLFKRLTGTPREATSTLRNVEVDLYTPASGARASLVLVPGAAVLGRDEPRLQNLARSLARVGFLVIVPELPGPRRLSLSRADADTLAEVLRGANANRPWLPSGIAAISYGVGPAIIAALEPDLVSKVDFIIGIGGYHSTDSVIRFLVTGTFRRANDPLLHRMGPNTYSRWVFLQANAGRLEDERDRDLLRSLADRRLEDSTASSADVRAMLSPQGLAVLDLLEETDPAKLPALIAALPEAVRRDIDALNLALHDLKPLKARLILVHGRNDSIIPYSESEALAAAARPGAARLFLVDRIGHVGFSAVTLDNAWGVWRAVDAVLAERR
ncbi:MAG: alpha/beta hydrolase [Alphaproteobacteria bacterium]|nr:alpha/beta hydrolase [Alphaproteobacteria bacterium]MCW5739520.1 alpha/beta hydrolase [Alphaproteobacteria bacterium]